jgi:hypothetical protein
MKNVKSYILIDKRIIDSLNKTIIGLKLQIKQLETLEVSKDFGGQHEMSKMQ